MVHVRASAQIIEDKDWLLAHVNRLTDREESQFDAPWSVNDDPKDYIDKMLKAVVGIELKIKHIESKWKISQNRSKADQQAVMQYLNDTFKPVI